jgi:hypothetical protein
MTFVDKLGNIDRRMAVNVWFGMAELGVNSPRDKKIRRAWTGNSYGGAQSRLGGQGYMLAFTTVCSEIRFSIHTRVNGMS